VRIRLVLLTAACLLGAVACGGSDAPPGEEEVLRNPNGEPGLTGTLTVFAAASLTDVFTELGDRLMAEHPSLEVRFNFAGSSALAAQIQQGAPADVFASADEAQLDRVAEAGLVGEVELFASNRLMLALPVDNPGGLEQWDGAGIPSLADLLDRDVVLAVCAPEVPCGEAAAEVLDRVGLADYPDTYEDDVRAVLTKVELGEVDAGLVYRTDVSSAGDAILAWAFTEAEAARNRYPVAVLEEAANPTAAQAFVDLLVSDEGRRVLTEAGFREP
jgi:molybdate transport system substrate-binding protein